MPSFPLQRDANTVSALDANAAGELTDDQREWLLWELEAAQRVYWNWPPFKPVWNVVYAAMVGGWALAVGLEQSWLLTLMALASGAAALAYFGAAAWQHLNDYSKRQRSERPSSAWRNKTIRLSPGKARSSSWLIQCRWAWININNISTPTPGSSSRRCISSR